MGTLHVMAHIGLDGGVEGIGGPDSPHTDEESGRRIRDDIAGADALLLGRTTYDLWRTYWPQQSDEIAEVFNRIPKYVASRGEPELTWADSEQVRNPVDEVGALKEQHGQIHTWGSVSLVQTLLRAGLVDELHLWLYPMTSSDGRRLIDDVPPWNFAPVEPAHTYARGVTLLHYRSIGPVRADR